MSKSLCRSRLFQFSVAVISELLVVGTGLAQTTVPAALQHAPAWMPPAYRSMMSVGVQGGMGQAQAGNVPQMELDNNPSGILATYQTGGATSTGSNAFFQSLGTNGRTCATCHQPASAMGLSAAAVQQRFWATLGTDPLFAPVDGANCPVNAGPAFWFPSHYSMLLNYGLFRIALPVPQNAQFTISVVNDPYGCNTTPAYNRSTDPSTGTTSQIVSVYRRPIMAANLKFKTMTLATWDPTQRFDGVTGLPLAVDSQTGMVESGNIMSDGREPTLASQALDATLGHAQASVAPTAAQVAQMVAFESGVYSAQYWDWSAGNLTSGGVNGGPYALSQAPAGVGANPGQEVVSAYDAWNPANGAESPSRASIYRGQQLFNNLTFIVSNDAGINNVPGVPNGIPLQCSSCHGQVNGTSEPHPMGQHTIGIGGLDVNLGGPPPSSYLPLFKVTCNAGYSTPFTGTTVLVNDPGKALITGKCADVGRFTAPQLRGLAAQAPYFHDGSAATLNQVVAFYNKRFNIGLTAQNSADLVAFLNSL